MSARLTALLEEMEAMRLATEAEEERRARGGNASSLSQSEELRPLIKVLQLGYTRLQQKSADIEQRHAAEILKIKESIEDIKHKHKKSIEDMKREHKAELTNLKDEMAQMKESIKTYERNHAEVSFNISKQKQKRAARSNESSPDPAPASPPKRQRIIGRAFKLRAISESEREFHTGFGGSEDLDDEDLEYNMGSASDAGHIDGEAEGIPVAAQMTDALDPGNNTWAGFVQDGTDMQMQDQGLADPEQGVENVTEEENVLSDDAREENVGGYVVGGGDDDGVPLGLMNIGAPPKKAHFSKAKEFKDCLLPGWVKDLIHNKDKGFKNKNRTDERSYNMNQNAEALTECYISRNLVPSGWPERHRIATLDFDLRAAERRRLWTNPNVECPECTWRRENGGDAFCFYFTSLSEVMVLPPVPIVDHAALAQ